MMIQMVMTYLMQMMIVQKCVVRTQIFQIFAKHNPQVKNVDGESCQEICKLKFSVKHKDVNGNFVVDSCENDKEDDDKDGIPNSEDNCPQLGNNNQHDEDHDGFNPIQHVATLQKLVAGVGDICDDDIDNDGIGNSDDSCPLISNKLQENGKKRKRQKIV